MSRTHPTWNSIYVSRTHPTLSPRSFYSIYVSRTHLTWNSIYVSRTHHTLSPRSLYSTWGRHTGFICLCLELTPLGIPYTSHELIPLFHQEVSVVLEGGYYSRCYHIWKVKFVIASPVVESKGMKLGADRRILRMCHGLIPSRCVSRTYPTWNVKLGVERHHIRSR